MDALMHLNGAPSMALAAACAFLSADAQKLELNDWNIHDVVQDYLYRGRTAREDTKDRYGPIEDWDTTQVTNMAGLFEWKCDPPERSAYPQSTNTDDIGISKWNTAAVTNMYGMFLGNTRFNDDISKWDVGSVTNMRDMFGPYHCGHSGIPSIFNKDISGWNVEKVESMSSMFYMAKEFRQDISKWQPKSLRTAYGMFENTESFFARLSDWHQHIPQSDGPTDISLDDRHMFTGNPYEKKLLADWD